MNRKQFYFIMFAASILGCSRPESSSLTVFAAGGIKPALDRISHRFERKDGTKVEVIYGGGGEVLSRMVLSRRGDLYLAPDQWIMEKAVEKRAIDPETMRNVAYLVPVIAVQKGNPKNILKLSDLAAAGVRIAISRPETTLLGILAPEIFKKAGLGEEIGKNVITHASDPNYLLTMLLAGQVDAVVTWHVYGNMAGEEIQTIPFLCDELTGIGEMKVAVSSFCVNRRKALMFIEFLTSPEGKMILEEGGYITDAAEARRLCR